MIENFSPFYCMPSPLHSIHIRFSLGALFDCLHVYLRKIFTRLLMLGAYPFGWVHFLTFVG